MLKVPTLVKRAVKGAPLTIAEGDQNWQDIMDFLSAINSQVSSAVQDNGTLSLYFRDAGVANAYAITPPNYVSAYLDGQFFLVKAANTNNGPSTLQVASGANAFLPAMPIRAMGADVPAGAINAGQIFAVIYDGDDLVFNLITGNANPATVLNGGGTNSGSNGVTTDQAANLANFNPADITIPLSQATGTFTGVNASNPPNGSTITIDGKVYTFQTALTAGDGHVLSGTSMFVSLSNLADAINRGAVAGNTATVGTGTVVHPSVAAVALAITPTGNGRMIVTAKVVGTAANSIATTTSMTGSYGTWGAGTLAGGVARVVLQLPHNLDAVPSGIDVGLICATAENNFAQGQVVPADSFFTANNQPAITYRADATYITISLTNDVFFVADQSTGLAANVSLSKWRFHLSAYAIAGIPTFNLPNPVPLTGPLTTQQFAHGLVHPTVSVSLIPNTAEFGHNVGELTPIDQFYDALGNPAFTVSVDSANVTIRENCAGGTGPYVTSVVDGTKQLITPANWGLQVFAFAPVAQSTFVNPAIDVAVANPDGAVSWNNSLFVFNYGNNAAKTYLSQIDLATGDVSLLQTFGPGNTSALAISYVNLALFKFGSDNLDRLVFTCNRGLFSVPLATPTVLRSYDTQDACRYKPIWIDESVSGNQSVANPTIYLAASGGNTTGAGYNTKVLGGIKVSYNGSSYVHASSWPVYVPASPGPLKTPALNLHDARIGNSSAFVNYHTVNSAIVLLFQYNPIKRRIYVVTNECGYLFIFHLKDGVGAGYFAGNNIAAWWDQDDDTRYKELEVQKVIAMAGGGGLWANALKERISIEYDTDTGEELSICYTRINNTTYLGSVTRIPWRE